MKTSYIVIALVAAVIVIGGIMLSQSGKSPSAGQQAPESVQELGPSFEVSVLYGAAGYSPNEIKVKRGDKVTFQNTSTDAMWTASAFHPSHEAYPGSSIQKCGTEGQSKIFDACQGIVPGESWTFQFNEAGEWGYHNHLRPNHWGKIIVE